jgi:hypothetical protein
MTILFDSVLRHRCPNDVQALVPPTYDRFPPFERLDDHREQVRAALWQFGGIVTSAARYLRVEPARLRRYVHQIDPTLLSNGPSVPKSYAWVPTVTAEIGTRCSGEPRQSGLLLTCHSRPMRRAGSFIVQTSPGIHLQFRMASAV